MGVDPNKVRSIQMGAALMTAMRKVGVGSQGGAEALAIFLQLIYDRWATRSLDAPLTRIKVDEKTASE